MCVLIKTCNTNVNHSLICNSPKLETTQMSIGSQTDEHHMVQPHSGIPVSDKKGA